MNEPSAFAVVTNLFSSPNEAFAAIRQRSRIWVPLVALIAGYALVSFAYMSSVDIPWFMERQIEMQTERIDEPLSAEQREQREQALAASSSMSPAVLSAFGTLASTVFILVWTFLVALYYTGISFATGDGIRLKQWFALVCWCALPVALGLLASLVNVLASDARFMLQEDLNPLSFRNLLSIDSSRLTTLERVLLNIDLSAIWAIVLSVLGYQAWTKRPFATSVAIVLGPLALIAALTGLLAA